MSYVVVCVQATKVLEGLLPDEQVPQHHHSRRNHDPDTEEIQQVSVFGAQDGKGKKVISNFISYLVYFLYSYTF